MRQKGAVNQSGLCGRQRPWRLGEGNCCSDKARRKDADRAGPALAFPVASRGPAASLLTSQASLDPSSPAQWRCLPL